MDKLDPVELLKDGYAFVKVDSALLKEDHSNYPLNLVSENFKIEDILRPGVDANFFLYKYDEVKFAVINGFLTNLKEPGKDIKNTLIFN